MPVRLRPWNPLKVPASQCGLQCDLKPDAMGVCSVGKGFSQQTTSLAPLGRRCWPEGPYLVPSDQLSEPLKDFVLHEALTPACGTVH